MNTPDELILGDEVREALVKIGFHPCMLRDPAVESMLSVRFDIVNRTKFGRFLILRLADKRTGTLLYQFTIEHPWLLRFLSAQLAKPIRIVEEFDGRVSLIVILVPFDSDLAGLSIFPVLKEHAAAVA